MQILLHDHIAATGEGRVLVADQGRDIGGLTDRVLRSVDKAKQIAIIEALEAMHFIDDRHRACEA